MFNTVLLLYCEHEDFKTVGLCSVAASAAFKAQEKAKKKRKKAPKPPPSAPTRRSIRIASKPKVNLMDSIDTSGSSSSGGSSDAGDYMSDDEVSLQKSSKVQVPPSQLPNVAGLQTVFRDPATGQFWQPGDYDSGMRLEMLALRLALVRNWLKIVFYLSVWTLNVVCCSWQLNLLRLSLHLPGTLERQQVAGRKGGENPIDVPRRSGGANVRNAGMLD